MQFSKDSFYMALRQRLASLNPKRTVAVNGVVRPALIVVENEPPTPALPERDAFYVSFGQVGPALDVAWTCGPLLMLEVAIAYRTAGALSSNSDRGRSLAALDSELLAICLPASAPKCDYTGQPAVSLGSNILWSAPQLGAPDAAGCELRRTAMLKLFFRCEETAQ